jgi:hypothetical protein
MMVVGVSGERIGTVERVEIDRSGQLKSLVVRIASAVGVRKRVPTEQIRSMHGDVVELSVSKDDIATLTDAT